MNIICKTVTTLLVICALGALPALGFEAPEITLDKIEVASVQPFFINPRIGYKDEKDPGKEEKSGYSSTLNLAYVFNIKNPNKIPVVLEGLQFTTDFEGFELATVSVSERSWIPGGKTNQLRVIVTNEAYPTILSLMSDPDHAAKIAGMKISASALVKIWWDEISNFTFPIGVSDGTALFRDEKGHEVKVAFSGAWEPKK